jgi:hypothetical protein
MMTNPVTEGWQLSVIIEGNTTIGPPSDLPAFVQGIVESLPDEWFQNDEIWITGIRLGLAEPDEVMARVAQVLKAARETHDELVMGIGRAFGLTDDPDPDVWDEWCDAAGLYNN